MQQGRVHLDADWNEQTSILLRYLQALASDLIGPHGDLGCRWRFFTSFQVLPMDGVSDDFAIGPGHYYVDGILCELAAYVRNRHRNSQPNSNQPPSRIFASGRSGSCNRTIC